MQVPVSKGSGLKAEWGESPREPVTVKLQLREMSQTRARTRDQKRRLVNGQLFPAGKQFLPENAHGVFHAREKASMSGSRLWMLLF